MCFTSVAVSPGDQLLHPEKKKTRAEREAEDDQVDSPAVPSKYHQRGMGRVPYLQQSIVAWVVCKLYETYCRQV